MGSPNVMIGGFPLPSFSAIAQGLLKRVKGLKVSGGGGGEEAVEGAPMGQRQPDHRVNGRFGPLNLRVACFRKTRRNSVYARGVELVPIQSALRR